MDKKILKNYLYNILYQMVKIVLPFILVPYTYAHITPPALGIYNFAGAIMQWFILFGILGVNTYGNREIAKVRDDKKLLNKTFFEIFYMQLCNMIIAMIAYYVYIQFTVTEHRLMYQLTGLTMLASMLDITWFFYGIEDFKKASIRNTIVKILGVSLIMLLCKKPEDLWLYILINVGSELFGQLIMFVQLRQYITFEKVSLKEAYHNHFKATFQLFVPTIAISVYTILDQTMLGYLYNKEHVSYYLTSMNIVKMFLYFITSIGAVALPRVTNLYYNDAQGAEKAKALINTTMKIALLLALPMCLGMWAITPGFIGWYLPTTPIIATLIRWACPIIIFISMSNVTGIQYMVPTGMYNQYSTSVIAGATINFIVNMTLIPTLGALGAVIGSIIAEISVTLIQFVMIHKQVNIHFFEKSYFIYLFGSILMMLVVVGIGRLLPIGKLSTLIQILCGMLVYLLVLVITKEDFVQSLFERLKKRNQNA
ncbi:MAG: oligosaccharide flippase family protein [Solobacterium sp.]|nr:oligosaccharide flippase family protein [Solobacterium sp.]